MNAPQQTRPIGLDEAALRRTVEGLLAAVPVPLSVPQRQRS